MKEVIDTAHFFFYGSLRQGGSLYESYVKHNQVAPPVRSTAKGVLHLAENHGNYFGFPVANFDEEGVVVGDLIEANLNVDIVLMVRMELNSGYVLREIDVTLDDGGTHKAWAFHYPGFYMRGTVLEDGDFLAYEASIR